MNQSFGGSRQNSLSTDPLKTSLTELTSNNYYVDLMERDLALYTELMDCHSTRDLKTGIYVDSCQKLINEESKQAEGVRRAGLLLCTYQDETFAIELSVRKNDKPCKATSSKTDLEKHGGMTIGISNLSKTNNPVFFSGPLTIPITNADPKSDRGQLFKTEESGTYSIAPAALFSTLQELGATNPDWQDFAPLQQISDLQQKNTFEKRSLDICEVPSIPLAFFKGGELFQVAFQLLNLEQDLRTLVKTKMVERLILTSERRLQAHPFHSGCKEAPFISEPLSG